MLSTTNRRIFLAWIGVALASISVVSSCAKSEHTQEAPAAEAPAARGSTAQEAPATRGSAISAPTLKGRAFEYQIDDYHVRLTFLGENSAHWEYVAAPGGLTGKNATETIDSMPIRNDIILTAWKEADGTQVLDVLDLGRMVIHTNYVTATGERHSAQAELQPVK